MFAGKRFARAQRTHLLSAARSELFNRVLAARVRDRSWNRGLERSEEHTSELQSLMRNSYAVFCLKKKTNYCSTSNYNLQLTNNTQLTIYSYINQSTYSN